MALTLSGAARRSPGLSFHHHPREPGTDRKQHYGASVNNPSASKELPLQPKVEGQTALNFWSQSYKYCVHTEDRRLQSEFQMSFSSCCIAATLDHPYSSKALDRTRSWLPQSPESYIGFEQICDCMILQL